MTLNPPILLVENSEKEANTLKIILENDGFVIDTASSGWAASEKLKVRRYAAVILDFGLSDMKGDVLVERVKLDYPGMIVILLTGFLSAVDVRSLEKFKYVFEKPADPKKIIDALRVITRDFR